MRANYAAYMYIHAVRLTLLRLVSKQLKDVGLFKYVWPFSGHQALNVKELNMCFENYSEHQWREDRSVKWSESFPVYMDNILISSVMRT